MAGRYPLVLAVVALLTACGTDSASLQAVDSATEWVEALRDEEIERVCGMQLPAATASIRVRFLARDDVRGCPDVKRAYRARMSDRLFETILADPLEAQSNPGQDTVGVFPAAEKLELSVILMRRVSDRWRVSSVTLAPDED